jgi:hypothetical protein
MLTVNLILSLLGKEIQSKDHAHTFVNVGLFVFCRFDYIMQQNASGSCRSVGAECGPDTNQ